MQEDSSRLGRSSYLDFDLEIGTGTGRDYPVAVLESPAGEARGSMHFPFDRLALENRLLTLQNALLRSGGPPRRSLSPEEQAVQDFGRELFEALFTPEVRSCFDVSLREADQQRKGLRLKLRIQSPEMAVLPWEYLYHPGQAEYVSLSTRTPIVRYLEMPQRIQPLAVAPPLRILGMIASPSELPSLNVEREKERIERAIRDLRACGLVDVTWLPGQTWRDLLRAMRQGEWHIFHFVGHGGFDRQTGEGLIVLADREGRAARFHAKQLGRLLANHACLRLVLLNSCEGAKGSERDIFSSTAATLVRRGIPAVLAMQDEITDDAAIEFARQFYEALADGIPVDGAMAEARMALSFAVTNTVEWGTPVLYMHSPDGVLFEMAETRGERVPARPLPEWPREAEGDHLYRRASQAVEAEQWEEALRLLRRVQEQEAGYRETERLLVRAEAEIAKQKRRAELHALYEQAQAARKAGDRSGAVSALEKLVAEAPDFHGAAGMLDELKTAAPAPGEVHLFAGVEMVYVPAGKFWMGSDDSDTAAQDDEKPQHEVFVGGFWIGRTPITNKEYGRFVDATGQQKPQHWKLGRIPEGKEDHPVVCVGWHDAQAYCRWRGEQAGVASRLPTEAEWEKAARGSDGRRYPWGDEFHQDKCNSREGSAGDTTPVGKYSPQGDSPYGCADMAGNVWEWTSSLWKSYPYDAEDGREDPDAGGYRVLRGGSWDNSRNLARCAYRVDARPDNNWSGYGFRVVVAPTLPS